MHVHGSSGAHPIVTHEAEAAHAAPAKGPDPRLARIETALARAPKHSETPSGHRSAGVNVVFVGSAHDLERSFHGGGWSKSDQSVKGQLDYAQKLARGKVDHDAPMSDRYMFGRKQDLAFERATGAHSRHHIRFWKSGETLDGQAIWLGAGTYDDGIKVKDHYLDSVKSGIEHGRIDAGLLVPTVHSVSHDVDRERETTARDLASGGAHRLGTIAGESHSNTDGRVEVLAAGAPPALESGAFRALDAFASSLETQLAAAHPRGLAAHAAGVARDPRPPEVRSLMVAHGAAHAEAHAASTAAAHPAQHPVQHLRRDPVLLGYYETKNLPHLIAAVKHGKLPAGTPVFAGTYGVNGDAAKMLHAAGMKYAPMYAVKDAPKRFDHRELSAADAAKLKGWPASAKYRGKPPTIEHLGSLTPTERVRWGSEVGMRIRDHFRKTGVPLDSWQLDEILGESRGSGASAIALRQFERGMMSGLTHGRPSLGDARMPGMVWFAHTALSIADQPDTPELRRFWKTVNSSSLRVVGEEYPNFGGDPRAAAHLQSHAERALAASGGVKGAIARKYMAGLTPGYHNPGGGLGGNAYGMGTQSVNRWREAYIRERVREGADGIAEYSWVEGNAKQSVMNDVMAEIGKAMRGR